MMLHHLSPLQVFWLVLGFTGQLLFGARLLIQWIRSERHRKSIVPIAFWWFSIVGGMCSLIYAIHTGDPVFISGQLFGVIVYVRNIWLIYNERKHHSSAVSAQ